MQRVLAGIAQNNFVVVGRAGMDFFQIPLVPKLKKLIHSKQG